MASQTEKQNSLISLELIARENYNSCILFRDASFYLIKVWFLIPITGVLNTTQHVLVDVKSLT